MRASGRPHMVKTKQNYAVGYKLFSTDKDGNLHPLYVYADKALPLHQWLKAEPGPQTENGHVQSRLGELAYRPGWHINDGAPYVSHIYSMHDGKKYLKDGTVWAEVLYHTGTDYQEKANDAGRNAQGIVIPSKAFIRDVPVNGYYRYKTSPQMTGAWIIAGEMYITRVLSMPEVEYLCRQAGYESLKQYKKEK